MVLRILSNVCSSTAGKGITFCAMEYSRVAQARLGIQIVSCNPLFTRASVNCGSACRLLKIISPCSTGERAVVGHVQLMQTTTTSWLSLVTLVCPSLWFSSALNIGYAIMLIAKWRIELSECSNYLNTKFKCVKSL